MIICFHIERLNEHFSQNFHSTKWRIGFFIRSCCEHFWKKSLKIVKTMRERKIIESGSNNERIKSGISSICMRSNVALITRIH